MDHWSIPGIFREVASRFMRAMEICTRTPQLCCIDIIHYRPKYRPTINFCSGCWCFGGSVCSDVDGHCLIVAILKACIMYEITREKFNALFKTKGYKQIAPVTIGMDEHTNCTTFSGTTVAVCYDLRKPLCED